MTNTERAMESVYQIKGNHCGGCKAKIEAHLAGINEIETAEMDLATKRLSVRGKVDPRLVLTALSEIGFDASLTV